jgi:hypothetical protein
LRLVKNFPWVTTVLLVASWVLYSLTRGFFTVPVWIGKFGFQALLFFFHPVLHLTLGHLVFDSILGLCAFLLLEKGTKLINRNQRGTIFVLCYLASLAAVFIKWRYVGPTLNLVLGLSGMISAATAFLFFYYLFFRREHSFVGPSGFAPFVIGILFWSVFGLLINWATVTLTWTWQTLGDTELFHLLAFGIASGLAFPLMLLIHRQAVRQERSPSSTSPRH